MTWMRHYKWQPPSTRSYRDKNVYVPQRVDFSHNVPTIVSIRKLIIWGIGVHITYKGEVLLFLVCTFKKATYDVEVNVDVQ